MHIELIDDTFHVSLCALCGNPEHLPILLLQCIEEELLVGLLEHGPRLLLLLDGGDVP